MSARQFVAVFAISFAAIGVARAAVPQQVPPVRDSRTQGVTAAARGTAVLSVLVTTDDEPTRPIRRAAVTIRAGELDVPRVGLTGDDGRVEFRDLAAGNYLFTAERAGYVRTFYGSPQPGRGPGVAVTVNEGQAQEIRIRILHGGVITGTLRSTSGHPTPNQTVRAIMVRSTPDGRRAVNEEDIIGRMVSTDDRGVYRIFGLPPGDYLVSVPLSGLASTDALRPITADELQWADRVVAAATSVQSAPAAPPPPPQESRPVAYAPVYYPGTAVVSDASIITLGPNEERSGVDFALQLVPTAQISGRVIDPDGRPMGSLAITVKPVKPDGMDLFASILNTTGRTNPDGTFVISGVRPGAYTLSVRTTIKSGADPAAPPDPNEMARQALGALFGGGSGFTHWASEDVSVQGTDVSGITLALRTGMTISGRVVYEATTKTPPTDLTKTSLALLNAPAGGGGVNELASSLIGGGSQAAKVNADGTFTISGVAPGRYRLNTPLGMIPLPGLSGLTGGWTLKSVMAGGRDIADATLEMKPGADVTNVVATFTDHPAELSGSVYDTAGRVTPDFPIVVFSTDRSYWTLASRRVQTARPSSNGKFVVTGLPAGEYYVCAVTAVDRTEVYDAVFLDQLVPVAFKITIADGEKKTQDLKLGGK